jgi:hypothetical protein
MEPFVKDVQGSAFCKPQGKRKAKIPKFPLHLEFQLILKILAHGDYKVSPSCCSKTRAKPSRYL